MTFTQKPLKTGQIVLRSRNNRRRNNKRKNIKRTQICKLPGLHKQLVPQRMLVKMTWTQNISKVYADNNLSYSHIFRGNSIYRPNYTDGSDTSQPMGHDQLTVLYNQYKVHQSKIKARIYNNAGSPEILNVVPTTATAGFASREIAEQQPFSKSRMVSAKGGKDTVLCASTRSTKSVLAFEKNSFDSDAEATVGFNPTEEWYWHVRLDSIIGGTFYLDIYYTVEITYYVELFDPKPLGAS